MTLLFQKLDKRQNLNRRWFHLFWKIKYQPNYMAIFLLFVTDFMNLLPFTSCDINKYSAAPVIRGTQVLAFVPHCTILTNPSNNAGFYSEWRWEILVLQKLCQQSSKTGLWLKNVASFEIDSLKNPAFVFLNTNKPATTKIGACRRAQNIH